MQWVLLGELFTDIKMRYVIHVSQQKSNNKVDESFAHIEYNSWLLQCKNA